MAQVLSLWLKTTCSCKLDILRLVTSCVWSAPGHGSWPYSFLLFTDDLPNTISLNIKLFADDCVLYHNEVWHMSFATKKCMKMMITLQKTPLMFSDHLCNDLLEGVSYQKYLREVITSTLNWGTQCEEVKEKANRVLDVLQLNLSPIKEHAYLSLVRPLAEYATTTWSPHTSKGPLPSSQSSHVRHSLFKNTTVEPAASLKC